MQLGLGINIPAARCLTTAETLRDFLRISHEEVMAGIDSGVVRWAWDISTPGADRAELRVWHPCAEALIQSGGRDSGPEIGWQSMLDQLVPCRDVRSSELERWWTTSHQHIHRLIASGSLPIRREPQARIGPNSYYLLTRDGVQAFLRSRCLSHTAIPSPTP